MELNYQSIKGMNERNWMAMFKNLKTEDVWWLPQAENILQELADDTCTSINVVSRIMNVYAEWIKTQFLDDDSLYDRERLKLFSADGLKFSHAQLMFLASEANDVNFTSALVSQGFIQVFPHSDETLSLVLSDMELFQHYFKYMRQRGDRDDMDDIEEDMRKERFLKRLKKYVVTKRKSDPRRFRRIIFLSKILKVLWLCKVPIRPQFQSDDLKDYTECLKLYFRAIPDSFVTNAELRDFLKLITDVRGDESTVDLLVECYDQLFHPESRLPSAPRSLKHLCRCAVRKSLMDNKSEPLPELVKKLNFPRKLKGFLINGAEKKQTM